MRQMGSSVCALKFTWLSLNCRRGCFEAMFACRAFWDTDRGTLRELAMLLAVVSWDEFITEISLTSRDNAGVDGDEVGEDEILVSVNKSVMCSSFFATILMSIRLSDEVSLGGLTEASTLLLELSVVSAWTSDVCVTL